MKKNILSLGLLVLVLTFGVFFAGCFTISHVQTASFFNKGVAFMNQENWDAAIEEFTKAIAIDRNHDQYGVRSYFLRGTAYLRKQDVDRAIADFDQSLQINPNNTASRDFRNHAEQARAAQ